MAGGYVGKILRLDMTTRTASVINTSDYEEWGGGHGMGSALFWDECEDYTVDGLDPKNVCTVMTTPGAGTLTPAVNRTEVQGNSTFGYPTLDGVTMHNNPWFNRSGFGGRFGGMLKAAGWDGVVIKGKASSPTWVSIINDDVTFRDAGEDGDDLWGKDTWSAQQEIWRLMTNNTKIGEWTKLPGGEYTSQRPAVLCIGPAGESLSRFAALVHDGGSGAGDGGFGGVWGSKNLKAIGALGTGDIPVDDPQELMDTRMWYINGWGYDVDDPVRLSATSSPHIRPGYGSGTDEPGRHRFAGCYGCFVPCRRRRQSTLKNDSQCSDSWFGGADSFRVSMQAMDMMQRYGFNARLIKRARYYVRDLYAMGILGPGKEIDSGTLQLEHYGSLGYAESLMSHLCAREEEFSNDLAEGVIRYAAQIGRLEEDLSNGTLRFPQMGSLNSEEHWTFCGGEWAYACLVDCRDINEHDFTFAMRDIVPFTDYGYGGQATGDVSAEWIVNTLAEKTIPYTGDPFMFDYGEGETGMYSIHQAKMVAYYRSATRFFKQSLGYCDWGWPQFLNSNAADFKGATPEAEPRFFNAVTGQNITYADGMEIGRKILNLERAIYALQGRHRDIEKFSEYMYTENAPRSIPVMLPVYKDAQWHLWGSAEFREPGNWGPDGKSLFDPDGVEAWKTLYYELQGWDTSSGYPSRATLEGVGLGYVADRLETAGKLGVTGVYQGP